MKTAEDFGAQGEWPSHPELLDWLATEFMRTGWDVKGMQRLLVTSATYRHVGESDARTFGAGSGGSTLHAGAAIPSGRREHT